MIVGIHLHGSEVAKDRRGVGGSEHLPRVKRAVERVALEKLLELLLENGFQFFGVKPCRIVRLTR